MIRDASIKALDKGRPAQTATDISANQSTLIRQVVQLERANSDIIIETPTQKYLQTSQFLLYLSETA